jgi:hypothetical protein
MPSYPTSCTKLATQLLNLEALKARENRHYKLAPASSPAQASLTLTGTGHGNFLRSGARSVLVITPNERAASRNQKTQQSLADGITTHCYEEITRGLVFSFKKIAVLFFLANSQEYVVRSTACQPTTRKKEIHWTEEQKM